MTEWVAEMTWTDEYAELFFEAGAVYQTEPTGNYTKYRELVPGEHVVECPRCGQRFAAADDQTAEACRDLHFDGDEEIPSICRHLPSPLRLVPANVGLGD